MPVSVIRLHKHFEKIFGTSTLFSLQRYLVNLRKMLQQRSPNVLGKVLFFFLLFSVFNKVQPFANERTNEGTNWRASEREREKKKRENRTRKRERERREGERIAHARNAEQCEKRYGRAYSRQDSVRKEFACLSVLELGAANELKMNGTPRFSKVFNHVRSIVR